MSLDRSLGRLLLQYNIPPNAFQAIQAASHALMPPQLYAELNEFLKLKGWREIFNVVQDGDPTIIWNLGDVHITTQLRKTCVEIQIMWGREVRLWTLAANLEDLMTPVYEIQRLTNQYQEFMAFSSQ